MEFVDVVRITIYTGEDVLWEDRPLYKAIIQKAKELNLGGVTVVQGKAGFAKTNRGLNNKVSHFLSGNANLPLVIEIVDRKEDIEKILPFLEKSAVHSCVTMTDCKVLVTDYLKEKFCVK